MRYLGLALYAEGVTDHDFLCPLLLRLCEDLCGQARQEVVLHEVLSLNGRDGDAVQVEKGPTRADRIFALAHGTREEWTVLFVHSDGARKSARIRDEQIEPALALLNEEPSLSGRQGCAVIPVYEMEAWALADPAALRSVSGRVDGVPVVEAPDNAADVVKYRRPEKSALRVTRRDQKTRFATQEVPKESVSVV